jgi:hypothetical protein
MANTIDTTQAQYFIPEIWANSALSILRRTIVATPRILRDSDVAAFSRGDVLHIPYPGTLTASAKAAGTEYALAQPTGEAEVQVTLNKHMAVSFVVEDIVRAQASQDVVARYVEAAAIALAEQIESDVIAELQTATGSVGTFGTDVTAATLRSAWKAMTDAKCPQDGRTLILHTKDAIALLADSSLANYFAWQRPQAIQGGGQALGVLFGFETYASQFIVTDTVPEPDQTKNVAFRRDAAIAAFRGLPEPPPNSGALAANVRDPESGVVLRSLMAYDARLGGVQVTLEALYGVKLLQDAKALVVRS